MKTEHFIILIKKNPSYLEKELVNIDSIFKRGEANGYLSFDKDHPLYEKDYDYINDLRNFPLPHGGWTFSSFLKKEYLLKNEKKIICDFDINILLDRWIIGWDTAHYDDNSINWSLERIKAHNIIMFNFYSKEENYI